ncbi:MAG: hypothetical protein M1820_004680 [Bogoriella megaspora]|nr:MAG: hypothetical protein M1820_004680 [Bogoriella megaspora]
MFNFTALLGALSDSDATQSLLELDGGIKILVDVGWDGSFDVAKLQELERHIPTLSFILLTHATSAHLGAFAHFCKHFPLFTRIPIYATTPVIQLGRTLLQDVYASTPLAATVIPTASLTESGFGYSNRIDETLNILLQPPTAEEIAGYFSLITPLKYSQTHQPVPSSFSPPLNGLTITAYGAGHTPGGTIWHIQHGLESIVYAVDWNQAKENILPGAAWLGGPGASGTDVIEQLRRPTALICSSRGAEPVTAALNRKRRDDSLIESIRNTIANGGTVLIPSDSSARMLELAYLLEHTWRAETGGVHADTYKAANIYLASKSCGATVRYARSMLEWMDESVIREAEGETQRADQDTSKREKREALAPFDFKHIKLVERKSQASRMLSSQSPRVILASTSSLEWGFSKGSLQAIASDERSLVILTERVDNTSSLGGKLWDIWKQKFASQGTDESAQASIVSADGATVFSQDVTTVALTGNDLSLYQQWLANRRQLQRTIQPDGGTTLETSADVVDEQESESSSSSDESDNEQQGKALNISATLSHPRHKVGLSDAELGINVLLRRKEVHDFDVRGRKGREKILPFVARKRRADDFGDIIRPEEYLRAEERDEGDGDEAREGTSKQESGLGQKRKWDHAANQTVGGRRPSSGPNKRRRPFGEGDGESKQGREMRDTNDDHPMSESDESDYEPAEATIEGPVKAVFSEITFTVRLQVSYIDFSGIHDKRSLQMLIPMIKPRKLILTGGRENETIALASDCRRLLGVGSEESNVTVFTPATGTTVNASVDTNAWTVKLTQGLVKKLQWQNVRGLGVVAITGSLEPTETGQESHEQASKKVKTSANEAQDAQEQTATATPALDVVPTSMASATRSVAQPLHVGDLRLADLRRIMQAAGHVAEFRGEGTLLIDSAVAVRKTGTGKIEIDGSGLSVNTLRSRSLEGTFHAVKRKIYEGLAVVASG